MSNVVELLGERLTITEADGTVHYWHLPLGVKIVSSAPDKKIYNCEEPSENVVPIRGFRRDFS